MSKSDEFLDLVQNHHYKGYFYDDKQQNFCLLGAANKVYGVTQWKTKSKKGLEDCFTHLEAMDSVIAELFPEAAATAKREFNMLTSYFNDHYGTKEDIMLVAKHFANKIDTIKE